MSQTPDTSLDAFEQTRESADDVSLRRKIARELRHRPQTTRELAECLPEHSLNAIRPRVNELLRMDCVERDGKRPNPSGHEAYVHHLTVTGERYAAGEVDPDPAQSLADARRNVVEAARDHCNGKVGREVLAGVVGYHDRLALKLDPEGSE